MNAWEWVRKEVRNKIGLEAVRPRHPPFLLAMSSSHNPSRTAPQLWNTCPFLGVAARDSIPGFCDSGGWSGFTSHRKESFWAHIGRPENSRELPQSPTCSLVAGLHPPAHTLSWNRIVLPVTTKPWVRWAAAYLQGWLPKRLYKCVSAGLLCARLWALGLLTGTHQTSLLFWESCHVYKHK